MLRWFLWPIAVLCACRSAPAPTRAATASARPEALPVAVRAGAAPAHPTALPVIDFGAHGLADAGCFALHDIATGAEQISSTKRCGQPRLPFSTFKMANAGSARSMAEEAGGQRGCGPSVRPTIARRGAVVRPRLDGRRGFACASLRLVLLFLLACGSSPPPPPDPDIDWRVQRPDPTQVVPPHTQALMVAHRSGRSWRPLTVSSQDFQRSCRGRETLDQRRERYLVAVGHSLDSEPSSDAGGTQAVQASAEESQGMLASIERQRTPGSRCGKEAMRWLLSVPPAIRYRVEVGRNGEVASLQDHSHGGDEAFHLCVAQALRAMRFPRQPRALSFDYAEELTLRVAGQKKEAVEEESLRVVAQTHQDEVRACFAAWMAVDSSAHGSVLIDVVIATDGTVLRAAADDLPPSMRALGCCIASRVEGWRFPTFPGIARLTYPFTLARGE